MSEAEIMIPKEEYDLLKHKADLFDHFVETEDLTEEEIAKINKAMLGPFLTKSEFLKKHPHLS